jgi:hypothetical protein
VVGDEEHQKILVALASLRQQGNLDGVSGTRDHSLAFISTGIDPIIHNWSVLPPRLP